MPELPRPPIATIVVTNWDIHQHYKDRDPPWIKLYRDMFTTESWVLGTDSSRLVQIAITLLAARYRNATPMKWALIRRVANLDLSEEAFLDALRHLEESGFLKVVTQQEVAYDDKTVAQLASEALAKRSSETEGEGEGETEEERVPRSTKKPSVDWSTVPNLDLPAWGVWLEYRSKRRLPPYVDTRMAVRVAAYPPEIQRMAIDESITQNWNGLFPDKVKPNGARKQGTHETAYDQAGRRIREWAERNGVAATGL